MTKAKSKKTDGDELFRILKAGNERNLKAEDAEKLGEIFDRSPGMVERLGNIAARAKEAIVNSSMNNSYLVREASKRKLILLRDSLGWAEASELEKILIEQICLNWFRLNVLECAHSSAFLQDSSLVHQVHIDKFLTQAQKRYLRAVESLAKVRKLLAEADFRQQQANEKRAKAAKITGKTVNYLTTGTMQPINGEDWQPSHKVLNVLNAFSEGLGDNTLKS